MRESTLNSCLWNVSHETLSKSLRGRGVSSDLEARKRAAVAINCKDKQIIQLDFAKNDQ